VVRRSIPSRNRNRNRNRTGVNRHSPNASNGWRPRYTCAAGAGTTGKTTTAIDCTITNTGKVGGDDVLMVFHRVQPTAKPSHPLPLRALVGFTRVTLAPQQSRSAAFQLEREAFGTTTAEGNTAILAGTHHFDVTDGVGKTVTVSVVVATGSVLQVVPPVPPPTPPSPPPRH